MGVAHDIGVLGSGPAALSIAAACVRRGASVVLIAPEPRAKWKPNYCLWQDEIAPSMESCIEHVWLRAGVETTLGSQCLDRSYAKLDTEAFQRLLWDRLICGEVEVVADRAAHLEHGSNGTRIETTSGASRHARVVIDASGGKTSFVRRAHLRPPAFQTAFGLLLQTTEHPFDPSQMVLMDFRPAPHEPTEPPSFLYVLPLSNQEVFVEETSLALRPAMDFELLRSRLEARLSELGLGQSERLAEEYCSIPMGLGLPILGQSVVPFGAAASMVHPASGYLISHVLRKAEPVAAAIAEGLDEEGPDRAVSAGCAALWPTSQRASWELYRFGLETLVRMSRAQMSLFFSRFFALPQRAWAGFLGGGLGPSELGRVMTRLFFDLPGPVQWHLVRTGFSAGAAPLASSIFRRGAAWG